MSKSGSFHRHAVTWAQLRELREAGWVIGTDVHPKIKIWTPHNGRNGRKDPAEIFIFRREG